MRFPSCLMGPFRDVGARGSLSTQSEPQPCVRLCHEHLVLQTCCACCLRHAAPCRLATHALPACCSCWFAGHVSPHLDCVPDSLGLGVRPRDGASSPSPVVSRGILPVNIGTSLYASPVQHLPCPVVRRHSCKRYAALFQVVYQSPGLESRPL